MHTPMSPEALVTRAKTWKQPQCLLSDARTQTSEISIQTHTHIHNGTIIQQIKKEDPAFVTTWTSRALC